MLLCILTSQVSANIGQPNVAAATDEASIKHQGR